MQLKGKVARTAYWTLIAGALAYEALIAFGDNLKSETLKEKVLTDNGVVWVTEQKREYCPWTVYQVTAFKGNETVYDKGTGLKLLADWRVKRAVKILENL
ncbi:hypothetical protein A3K73_04595 [Candidatus Pacearchaeota archaeon RBG_13_36_9]|nr:MAG: hypothetical protein A3K73_04595 [Candidatus Pacearchaeota archaeon RBG_13_36_9]